LSNRDYHCIKQVVIKEKPMLAQFEEDMSEEGHQMFASYVNDLLIPPILKDVGVFGKVILFICWVGLFILPIYLLISLDFNWYFEKL